MFPILVFKLNVSFFSLMFHFILGYKGNLIDMDSYYTYQSINFIYSMGDFIVEQVFTHKEIQKLLKSTEHYDLIIMEQFLNEALLYFGHHFKAPVIILCAIGSGSWTNQYVGNPAPLSHVPSVFLTFNSKMSFVERVQNVVWNLYDNIYRALVVLPKQDEILHKHHPNAPHLDVLIKNVSLVLLNSHVSVSEPVPHVPNMIEIGGYHVNPSGKLSEDIKQFLDAATEGVVYFCMGSNLKTSLFPKETQQAFLNTFKNLKHKVLWKFETDLPGKPDNVKLVKWAPQQDILAHPNVKVFISHGGNLGSIEAVHFGVPVLGIPVFGDQKANIATSVERGYALSVALKDVTEENLGRALNEILTNKK